MDGSEYVEVEHEKRDDKNTQERTEEKRTEEKRRRRDGTNKNQEQKAERVLVQKEE